MNFLSQQHRIYLFMVFFATLIISSCQDEEKKGKEQIHKKAEKHFLAPSISDALDHALANEGLINDTLSVSYPDLLNAFYRDADYRPVWSDTSGLLPVSDSLYQMIGRGLEFGLFPGDYNYPAMKAVRDLLRDSIRKKDPVLLTTADLLHTDAFMRMAGDLRQGRLRPDSLAWQQNSNKQQAFFIPMLNYLLSSGSFSVVIDSLQPKHEGYRLILGQIRGFLESMERKEYTYLHYPWKKNDDEDSLRFIRDLLTRLNEVQIGDSSGALPDSAGLADLVSAYQKKKGIKADGKVSSELVTRMNGFDIEKYRRLAITLDRYKQLPDSFSGKYILVNLPEYKLYVRERDSLLLESRIICGKPGTPTPELTSSISELVVFPTWTVPESIIKKEILPALKRNSGYLSRKGMYLLDRNGKRVRADTVNWARFSKGIPYKVQQGSGEDNALGVLKFNFASPHMIYLHDTDGRHLFKNSRRAMSHGCVRVQEWEKLAALVIENDSAQRQPSDSLIGYKDSITNWISRKERHIIKIKNHFPLYIRYLGCGVQEGKLVFFEDIYKLDKELRNQYFSEKKILPYL